MPQVSTSRAPGNRSLKIRLVDGVAALEATLVGYFLGPAEPSHGVDFDAMRPAGGWAPFTAAQSESQRGSPRPLLLPSEQAAKPTFELMALTLWKPYHRQDDGRWRRSFREGPRGRRFPGA